jgi:eukaryotic-like serine/threonine-protein kinase
VTDPRDPQAPDTPASLSVGDVVAERYRIDAVVGEGGMGIVYRAEHLHLCKPHALKVLLPEWSSMPEVVARFEREAVAAGNIESPHVAAATDFGRLPGGSFFLVMEYVDGRTLRSVLDRGPLDPARAVHVLRGIAAGLRAAHAVGIVHRDMKPENVMLVLRDGDSDFVKVLDFGIAKVDGLGSNQAGPSNVLTRVGSVIGTPDYMSPEQALGQPVDARSDLYSVGVILFEMLAGRCPYVGGAVTVLGQHVTAEIPELPSEVAAGVDPRIRGIVRRLLAKAPENRFADTTELLSALDELSVQPPPLRPPDPQRLSLELVSRRTGDVAQRLGRSALSGMRAVEAVTRRVLADPRALREHATRGRLLVAAVVLAVLVATIVAVVGLGSPAAESTAADRAPGVAPTGASTAPPFAPTGSVESLPVPALPPPPAPSSTAAAGASARPASSRGQSRQTGPGGIYIPPPSQWFK